MLKNRIHPISTWDGGRNSHNSWIWLSLVAVFTAAMTLSLGIGKRAQAWPEGTWTISGSMSTPRVYHAATLLANGKVLVTGGRSEVWGPSVASAELYDPKSGKWLVTGSMHGIRSFHQAILLQSGKVLVVGGQDDLSSSSLRTAELYDPVSQKWTMTGSLNSPRSGFVSILLTSGPLTGQVLVAGGGLYGQGGDHNLTSAELYNPGTGRWTTTGAMKLGRYWEDQKSNIEQLAGGSVLIVGGVTIKNGGYTWLNEAEVYNQTTRTWSVKSPKFTLAQGKTALLPDGRVLVTGGQASNVTNGAPAVSDAEIFNQVSNAWSRTARMSVARFAHSLTPLTNGQILVTGGGSGGWGDCTTLSTAQRYAPASGKWLPAASMKQGRGHHTATRLQNGKVLVVGGSDSDAYCSYIDTLNSAEIYSYPQPTPSP